MALTKFHPDISSAVFLQGEIIPKSFFHEESIYEVLTMISLTNGRIRRQAETNMLFLLF